MLECILNPVNELLIKVRKKKALLCKCFIPVAKNKVKDLKIITVVPLYPQFHFFVLLVTWGQPQPKILNWEIPERNIS